MNVPPQTHRLHQRNLLLPLHLVVGPLRDLYNIMNVVRLLHWRDTPLLRLKMIRLVVQRLGLGVVALEQIRGR